MDFFISKPFKDSLHMFVSSVKVAGAETHMVSSLLQGFGDVAHCAPITKEIVVALLNKLESVEAAPSVAAPEVDIPQADANTAVDAEQPTS